MNCRRGCRFWCQAPEDCYGFSYPEAMQQEPRDPIDPRAVLRGWGALILGAFTLWGCAYGFLKHFGVM